MPDLRRYLKRLSIAQVLRVAFVLLVLLPMFIVMGVAYYSSGEALRDEIRQRAGQEAIVLMQNIDSFLFERLENLRGWRNLDVMQEVSVGDIDKRLAEFLRQVRDSYGSIYHELFVVDEDGRVVASSNASHIGMQNTAWDQGGDYLNFVDMPVEILPVQIDGMAAVNVLPIKTSIRLAGGDQTLGYLYALIEWRSIDRILERGMPLQGDHDRRAVLLLSSDNRLLGDVSRARGWEDPLTRLAVVLPHLILSNNQNRKVSTHRAGEHAGGSHESDVSTLADSEMLAAHARSRGFEHFKGLGWRVVILESIDAVFAPVRRLAGLLLIVLLVTVLLVIVAASRLGRWVAGPITRLADFSAHYEEASKLPEEEGVAEVRTLNQAIRQMLARIENSRRQLVYASKLAAVGELAATLAHEVRTPLGILRSSSQLLRRETNLSDQGREMTDFIVSESERLNRLITLLLESGRSRSPQLLPSSLEKVLGDTVSLLSPKAAAKGIEFEYRFEHCPAVVDADSEQMQQVFLNLLLNAIQVLEPGGRIMLRCHLADSGVIVSVEDSGPGVDEADRSRIFDPFFSRRDGGFGLGLSIVQHIVSQHRGRINVDVGKSLGGACFEVWLPLNKNTKK